MQVDESGPEGAQSPISKEALGAARTAIQAIWKRIEKRAPDAVRVRVDAALAAVEVELNAEAVSVKNRLEAAKALEDLGAELRGRRPWEPTFYRDGRLAVVRAQDPITIQGAVDQVALERFYDRYVRRAEAAYARMQWFLERAGALTAEDKKVERKPWEQPYLNFDQYRELLWGKIAKSAPKVRRE